MSMTYYAVTDDPNELAHYGILGMKWGVRKESPRHTGSRRPRSAAYKKAQSKLGKMMKSGIKKAQTKWEVYNSPVNKQIRAEKRYDRQTNRALEKARKGKLKYGKLTDDQVQRITDRLYLERQARSLSETEKTFGKRLRESIGQGVITGVGSGVGRIVSEKISRGSTLKTDRKRMEQQEEFDKARAERQFRQEQKFNRKRDAYNNSRAVIKREADREMRKEYYKEAAEQGQLRFSPITNRRAKYLSEVKDQKKLSDYNSNIQKIYDETYSKNKANNDARLLDEDKRTKRKDAVKLEPTKVTYLNPDPESKRKKLTGSKWDALNAWNETHENANKYGREYDDSLNTSLAKRKADTAKERAQAEKDRAFNEALRAKQRQDATRESARIQREQERQARLREEQERRARIDSANTSSQRHRRGKTGNRKG